MVDEPISPANGKATVQQLLDAVMGLHGRIDDLWKRVDDGFAHVSKEIDSLQENQNSLKLATNDALHLMQASLQDISSRVNVLEKPWRIAFKGIRFSVENWHSLALAASMIVAVAAYFHVWPLSMLPF